MEAIKNFNIRTRIKTKADLIIWAIVIILSLTSLIAIYSSTGSLAYRVNGGHPERFLIKRLIIVVIGFLIMYIAHTINYTYYKRFANIFLIISVLLLGYTLFFGVTLNEGSRWISIPVVNVTFQSSDVAKLALIIYLSAQLSKFQNTKGEFTQILLWIFLPTGIVCGLIAPANLSTALIIAVCSGMMFFIGRIQFSYLAIMGGVLIIILTGAFMFSGRSQTWQNRISNFTSSEKSVESYQVTQAKMAIAKGGLLGKGPGNSTQRNFLPHAYSDTIYAFLIEEYGLIVGGFGLVFLYLLLLWRSIVIFRKCPYAFGAFLAVGLSFTLVFQAFIHMAVNVNLLPVTGQTLPLISKGGSSVWFTCLTIGVILSVSKFVNENHKEAA